MHKPLYIRQLDQKVHDKLDKITKETKAKKWMIIEKLLADALKLKNKNVLNLDKWTK